MSAFINGLRRDGRDDGWLITSGHGSKRRELRGNAIEGRAQQVVRAAPVVGSRICANEEEPRRVGWTYPGIRKQKIHRSARVDIEIPGDIRRHIAHVVAPPVGVENNADGPDRPKGLNAASGSWIGNDAPIKVQGPLERGAHDAALYHASDAPARAGEVVGRENVFQDRPGEIGLGGYRRPTNQIIPERQRSWETSACDSDIHRR